MSRKRECPSCAVEVPADVRVCPICQYEFADRGRGAVIGAGRAKWIVVTIVVALFLYPLIRVIMYALGL